MLLHGDDVLCFNRFLVLLYLFQPTEAPMPAFDKDKHIMNKIEGVAVQVNVSLPVAFFFNNENPRSNS